MEIFISLPLWRGGQNRETFELVFTNFTEIEDKIVPPLFRKISYPPPLCSSYGIASSPPPPKLIPPEGGDTGRGGGKKNFFSKGEGQNNFFGGFLFPQFYTPCPPMQ